MVSAGGLLRLVPRRARPVLMPSRTRIEVSPNLPRWRARMKTPEKEAKLKWKRENPDPRKGEAKRERKRFMAAHVERIKELESQAEALQIPYALTTAIIVERTPIVVPEPEEWEVDFMRLKRDLEYYQRLDLGPEVVGKDLHAIETKNHEDRHKLPKMPFKLAPRYTVHDEKDNRKSMERALMHCLYLLVKQDGVWGFPHGPIETDEMIYPATVRAVENTFGKELYMYVLGTAPQGLWLEGIDEETTAAKPPKKTYFQKGIIVNPYDSGPVILGKGVSDYVWAKKGEIGEYIQGDPKYDEFIDKMLSVNF